MNKYRIKHYYDVYLRKEVYMPQMKKWWGWENLLDGHNPPHIINARTMAKPITAFVTFWPTGSR